MSGGGVSCRPSPLDKQARILGPTLMYVWRNAGREWEQLRASGAYEHDFFFVSQLFEDNWKPQSTI